MGNWKKLSLATLGTAGSTLGLSLWLGRRSWDRETRQKIESLKRSVSANIPKYVSFGDISGLPEPVQKYFRFALKDNGPIVRTAFVRHHGDFDLGGGWMPFESVEYFSADPPGFVWDAKLKMNPLMRVRVRDGYFAGQGSMVAKAYALYTVAEGDSRDERLAEGALLRYLAEAVWLPTALLPHERLTWLPVDENRARATLTDLGLSVSLEFSFGEHGEVTGVFSPDRYMESGGEYRKAAWAARLRNYHEHSGMMVPEEGEVEWQLPEGDRPYWKGRLVEAKYNFVP